MEDNLFVDEGDPMCGKDHNGETKGANDAKDEDVPCVSHQEEIQVRTVNKLYPFRQSFREKVRGGKHKKDHLKRRGRASGVKVHKAYGGEEGVEGQSWVW